MWEAPIRRGGLPSGRRSVRAPSQCLSMSAEDFHKRAFMRLSFRLDQTIQNQLDEKFRQSTGTFVYRSANNQFGWLESHMEK